MTLHPSRAILGLAGVLVAIAARQTPSVCSPPAVTGAGSPPVMPGPMSAPGPMPGAAPLEAGVPGPADAVDALSPAHVVPADFDVWIEVVDATAVRRSLASSPVFEKLRDTKLGRALITHEDARRFIAKVAADWQAATGEPLEASFESVFGVRTALALRHVPGKPEEGLFVGRAKDAASPKRIIGKLVAHERSRGHDVAVANLAGGAVSYTLGKWRIVLMGDVWAMTENAHLPAVLAEVAAGKAPRLSDHPPFRQAMAELPRDASVRAVVDAAGLFARQPRPGPGPELKAREWMESVAWAGAAVSFAPRHAELEVRLRARGAPPAASPGSPASPQGPPSGAPAGFHPLLAALLAGPTVEPTAAAILPDDVLGATGIALDPAAVRNGLEAAFPQFRDNPELSLVMDGAFNVYANRLGPEVTLAAWRVPGEGPAVGKRPPTFVLAVQVRDASVVRTVKAGVGLLVKRLNGGNDQGRVKLADSEYAGVPVTTVDVAGLLPGGEVLGLGVAVKPAMAEVGGHLVIAGHESALHAIIDAAAGRRGRLSDSPQWRDGPVALAARNTNGPGGPAGKPDGKTRVSGWGTVSAAGVRGFLQDNRTWLLDNAPANPEVSRAEAGKRFDAVVELLGLLDGAAMVRKADRERIVLTFQVRAGM